MQVGTSLRWPGPSSDVSSLVTAILQEWQASGAKGLATYAAGSWGPRVAEEFIERDRRQWDRL